MFIIIIIIIIFVIILFILLYFCVELSDILLQLFCFVFVFVVFLFVLFCYMFLYIFVSLTFAYVHAHARKSIYQSTTIMLTECNSHTTTSPSYFSFQPVTHDWCNKGRGMCYPVCGMVHIKEPFLLIEKSSPCGSGGFTLSLSEWSFTICLTPYNRK